MNPWQCTTCSVINSGNAVFCCSCGNRLPTSQGQDWFCGSCGLKNSQPARFCMRCGGGSPRQGFTGTVNSVLQPVSVGGYPAPLPDFTTKAVITAVLYAVFWFPGIIGNVLWWLEAKRIKERAGSAPPGYGCLLWMLILFVGIPLVLIALFLLFLLLAGISLTNWLAG
jgi:hypothetical protein